MWLKNGKNLAHLIYLFKRNIPNGWLGNGISGCHSIFVESPRCRRARARLHRAAEAHDVETMIRRGPQRLFCFCLGTSFNLFYFFSAQHFF